MFYVLRKLLKYQRLQAENVGGYEREVNKSLNTGLITLNRSGREKKVVHKYTKEPFSSFSLI